MKPIKFYTPRIIAILYILFMSIFSLDVFGEYKGIELLIALFMHLIPSIVLTIILIIAWRWELQGGYIFLLQGIIFTVFFKTYRDPIVFLIITGPLFLIGVLFILSYKKRNKLRKKKK